MSKIVTEDSTLANVPENVESIVFLVGISGLKVVLRGCTALSSRQGFRKVSNLFCIEVMPVLLYLERKIRIDFDANAGFGFEETTRWSYLNLDGIPNEF